MAFFRCGAWRGAMVALFAVLSACSSATPAEVGDAAPGSLSAQQDAGDAAAEPAALWASDALPAFDAATVDHVRALHATGRTKGNRDDVFMKIGDSITASTSFLLDVGNGDYVLGDYGALEPTIKAFLAVTFDDNTNPFTRYNDAVQSGETTRDLVMNLRWITAEAKAIHPAWAIVMFGTDDLDVMEADEFKANYEKVISVADSEGVVLVLSTVPWRPEYERAERLVPVFDDVIRALAAEHHLPLVDLIKALDPLPHRGISDDDVHPTVETIEDGGTNSGDFTKKGLEYGYNMRNLTTIQMFDRLRAVVR